MSKSPTVEPSPSFDLASKMNKVESAKEANKHPSVPQPTFRKRSRLNRFKPNLKLMKIEAKPADPQPKEKGDDTYKYKISESGNFVIRGESSTEQIKVGNSGISVSSNETSNSHRINQTPSSSRDPNFSPDDETSFEDFKVIKRLGSGAQGSVEKVKNQKTKQIFAMKTLRIDSTINTSPKMLITEFWSLYSCECKNIVTMYHAFHKEGTLYLILELMNCGSLGDIIRLIGALPEQIISKVCVQMLNGLSYLHSRNIMHRDVKPANVLLNDKGIVKITDFGMAGMRQDAQANFQTYQGSALYMSPERASSEPYSYVADVWSLGVTLAEAALGRPLFPPSEIHFHLNLKKGDKVPLTDLQSFSPEFQDFIADCLEVDPDKRKSAKELLHSPFILKHYKSKPSLQKWLRKEYIPLKKEENRKKRKSKHGNSKH